MKKRYLLVVLFIIIFILAVLYIYYQMSDTKTNDSPDKVTIDDNTNETVTNGIKSYQNFLLDNVFHSKEDGNIHYNIYIPESYDGSEPYALYMTLPGYQGLYFQGIGVNLETEDFGFAAQNYNPHMIIVAPQLNDWQETSANQTIALTEYMISHYNIDTSKVYANGYSGGGETMSLVMGMRPDLFTAYLHCSSKWNGSYEVLTKSQTPVYIVIGENDEYYGSESSRETYRQLYQMYADSGMSNKEISAILVLDVKPTSYFESQGIESQHGGGTVLFAHDDKIMSWLFSK